MNELDTTRRIDALEERVAYQDEAIETLNQTITKQWAQIDALTRQLAQFGERLREARGANCRWRRATAALLTAWGEHDVTRAVGL